MVHERAVQHPRVAYMLAAGSFLGKVLLIDPESGKTHVEVRRAHRGPCKAVTVSPDGTLVASGGYDALVKLWNMCGEEHVRLVGHSKPITAVNFCDDQSVLASSSEDGSIHLWDTATGELMRVLGPINCEVHCVAFDPSAKGGSRLASGGHDCRVRQWALHGGTSHGHAMCEPTVREYVPAAERVPGENLAHQKPVVSLAYSPDGGRLACGYASGRIEVLDAVIGLMLHMICPTRPNRSFTNIVAFSPDGLTLAFRFFPPHLATTDHATHFLFTRI
jgi:WD40 repeat protein